MIVSIQVHKLHYITCPDKMENGRFWWIKFSTPCWYMMQFSPGPADSSLRCFIFFVRSMKNAIVNWMIVEIGYILYPQYNSHLVSLVRILKPTYMSTRHCWNLSWCWEKRNVEILLVIPRKIFTIWEDMSCCQAILSFWPKVVFERLNLW